MSTYVLHRNANLIDWTFFLSFFLFWRYSLCSVLLCDDRAHQQVSISYFQFQVANSLHWLSSAGVGGLIDSVISTCWNPLSFSIVVVVVIVFCLWKSVELRTEAFASISFWFEWIYDHYCHYRWFALSIHSTLSTTSSRRWFNVSTTENWRKRKNQCDGHDHCVSNIRRFFHCSLYPQRVDEVTRACASAARVVCCCAAEKLKRKTEHKNVAKTSANESKNEMTVTV